MCPGTVLIQRAGGSLRFHSPVSSEYISSTYVNVPREGLLLTPGSEDFTPGSVAQKEIGTVVADLSHLDVDKAPGTLGPGGQLCPAALHPAQLRETRPAAGMCGSGL